MGGLGRMAVEMGIDPQQADRRPRETRDAAPRADGDRVVAADDQGKGCLLYTSDAADE